jgi:hypothetical protein
VHAVAFDALKIVVQPRVRIARDGADIWIWFDTASGARYRVEQSSDAGASWTTVYQATITGTGGEVAAVDAGVAKQPTPRIYRLVTLP